MLRLLYIHTVAELYQDNELVPLSGVNTSSEILLSDLSRVSPIPLLISGLSVL